MVSLFKIFSCCSSSAAEVLREEAEEETTNHNEIDNIIHQTKSNKNKTPSESPPVSPHEVRGIIDNKYLSQIELERIKPFTVSNIISFMNEMEQTNKNKLFLKTDNIELYIQISGSPLYPDVYFGKTIYSFPKDKLRTDKSRDKALNINKDTLATLLISPKERLEWDKGVYALEILDTLETNDPKAIGSILHIVYNSPMIGVSKRDIVDKLIMIKEDDVLYGYQSSIDDNISNRLAECKDNIIRGTTYINTFKIWEDEDYFHMMTLYQTDMKIKLPESFISISLPFGIKKFYSSYYEKLKQYNNQINKEEIK